MVEMYTVRISDDLHAEVIKALEKVKSTRSDFCRTAIEERVQHVLHPEDVPTTSGSISTTTEYELLHEKYTDAVRERDISVELLKAKAAHINDLQLQLGILSSELSKLTDRIPMLPPPSSAESASPPKKKKRFWQKGWQKCTP